MWQAWTGCRPLAGLRMVQVIAAVRQHTALRSPGDMPAPIRDLGVWCMHPQPGQRPSVQEVAAALEAMLKVSPHVTDL